MKKLSQRRLTLQLISKTLPAISVSHHGPSLQIQAAHLSLGLHPAFLHTSRPSKLTLSWENRSFKVVASAALFLHLRLPFPRLQSRASSRASCRSRSESAWAKSSSEQSRLLFSQTISSKLKGIKGSKRPSHTN